MGQKSSTCRTTLTTHNHSLVTMLNTNKRIRSPGGSFVYEVQGPACILYDRNELPWPSCSLQWKGKQPSWNRQGRRLVPDMAASRCHAYSVKAFDLWGSSWEQVLVMYDFRLTREEKDWWYWRYKPSQEPPNYEEI
jgi:hypothetical protein